MKNIYLLPTPNPSRLFENVDNDLSLNDDLEPNGIMYQNQNIYITNYEEIKDGNWVYDIEENIVYKWTKKLANQVLASSFLQSCKKIILTTDPDLIKDGLRTIPDEFLEWFVKNQNCNEVKIRKNCCEQCDERLCEINDLGYEETKYNTFYEIIIPEPNWDELKNSGLDKPLELITPDTKAFSLIETLEEGYESYELAQALFKEIYGYEPQIKGNKQHELIVSSLQKGMIKGSKLQDIRLQNHLSNYWRILR